MEEEGRKGDGLIYFAETPGGRSVKIGFTSNLKQRLECLSVKFGRMRLLAFFPGSHVTEFWLHDRFSDDRLKGDLYRESAELREFTEMIGTPRYARIRWTKMVGCSKAQMPKCLEKWMRRRVKLEWITMARLRDEA